MSAPTVSHNVVDDSEVGKTDNLFTYSSSVDDSQEGYNSYLNIQRVVTLPIEVCLSMVTRLLK